MKKLIGFTSRLTGIIFLSAIFMILNNCSKESDTSDIHPGGSFHQLYEVNVSGYYFTPAEIRVPVDSTVTWRNTDGLAVYRIVSDSGHFTGTIRPGESYTHVFKKPGTFYYRGEGNYPPLPMKGDVIVY